MSGMTEALTRTAWIALAVIHVSPAAVLVAPGLVRHLYAVEPTGPAGVLIVHRGALFLAIVALALWASLDPAVRRAASVAVAISVIGFLFVYARAGLADGALRTIAIADAAALLPLAWVGWKAWSA